MTVHLRSILYTDARVCKVTVEDSIALKETTYLESTPNGNIISGFDNYMKGQSGAAAQRRKVGTLEQNKVFSKSSLSYRPNSGVSTSLISRYQE